MLVDCVGSVARLPMNLARLFEDTPFSDMLTHDFEAGSSSADFKRHRHMSQTSGVNPSLYTNYRKPKTAKKPAGGKKKGC
jgi:hypothetical protein